ncbi:hypothetical protein THOG11_130178 [Vibrio harveyi]|nr:hypothetical protein TH15OA1_230002 [Vibrio harveyi]CAH1550174.1 hypothetical protein THOD03_130181 [Vibrio harveyi]CAH1554579.1 hypothetical protein THOG11_130178 [Vibrio harveyi]
MSKVCYPINYDYSLDKIIVFSFYVTATRRKQVQKVESVLLWGQNRF